MKIKVFNSIRNSHRTSQRHMTLHDFNSKSLFVVRHFLLKEKTNKKSQSCLLQILFYSPSCKTMNTRENFWNVYCFTTNQIQDETAKK